MRNLPEDDVQEKLEQIDPESQSPPSKPQLVSVSWQGPVPPPGILQAYEDVEKGLANRLITQMETEGEHRRKDEVRERTIEEKIVDADIFLQKTSIFVGPILFLTVFITSALMIANNLVWQGSVVGGINIIAILWIFRGWSFSKNDEDGTKD